MLMVCPDCPTTLTDDVPGATLKKANPVSVVGLVDTAVLNVSVIDVADAECDTVSAPSVADVAVDDVRFHVTVGHATVLPVLTTLIVPVPVRLNV